MFCVGDITEGKSCVNMFSIGLREHAVAQWLRYYATCWKVEGSRLDEVTEFFQPIL
jgi:hypothetical protein